MITVAIYAGDWQTDREKARALYFKGMEMLNQTYRRRLEDWRNEPRPPKPSGPFGGEIEISKWKSRVHVWQEKQNAAKTGDIFPEDGREVYAIRALVRKYCGTYGECSPSELETVLQPIIEAFAGSPIEKEARRAIAAANGEAKSTEDAPPAPLWDIGAMGLFDPRNQTHPMEDGHVVVDLRLGGAPCPWGLGHLASGREPVKDITFHFDSLFAEHDYWLSTAWHPGASGDEQFEVICNGASAGKSALLHGDPAVEFYERLPDEQWTQESFPVRLSQGPNTITLRYLSGDGMRFRTIALSDTEDPPPWAPPPWGNDDTQANRREQVRRDFRACVHNEAGTPLPTAMGELRWSDIPILLELAESSEILDGECEKDGQTMLKVLPANPFSSYLQKRCVEGMAALWLIEGLRRYEVRLVEDAGLRESTRAPRLALVPLNPMCRQEGLDLTSCEDSVEIHKRALDAYREWWLRVGALEPSRAALFDPLDLAGITWYGAAPQGTLEIFAEPTEERTIARRAATYRGGRIQREVVYELDRFKLTKTLELMAADGDPITEDLLLVQKVVLRFFDENGNETGTVECHMPYKYDTIRQPARDEPSDSDESAWRPGTRYTVEDVAAYHRAHAGAELPRAELKRLYTEVARKGFLGADRDSHAMEDAAERALAFDQDPATGAMLFARLGDAIRMQDRRFTPEIWSPRRHKVAQAYFAGLCGVLEVDLPTEAPELPSVGVYNVDGPPETIEEYRRKHAREVAAQREEETARREAQRLRELVKWRKTLTRQIVHMYAREPEAFDELRELAIAYLDNPDAADQLVAAARNYVNSKSPIPVLPSTPPAETRQEAIAPGGLDETGLIAEFGEAREVMKDEAGAFFFYDGAYVDLPYVVERRGLAIYVNDRLIEPASEWPPYDWRALEDPGEPPPGEHPCPPEVIPGVGGRDTYWARKARYLSQHHDPETARRIYFETLQRASKAPEANWSVEWRDGLIFFKSPNHESLISVDAMPAEPPPTKQEVQARHEERMASVIRKLRLHYQGIWVLQRGQVRRSRGPEKTVAILDILLSDADAETKRQQLIDGDFFLLPPDSPSMAIVTGFRSTPQLLERHEALKGLLSGKAKRPSEKAPEEKPIRPTRRVVAPPTPSWDIGAMGLFDQHNQHHRMEDGHVVVDLRLGGSPCPWGLGHLASGREPVKDITFHFDSLFAEHDYWLSTAWHPGASGDEQFEVMCNGASVGKSALLQGDPAVEFYEQLPDEQWTQESFKVRLTRGHNTISLHYLSGDGMRFRTIALSDRQDPRPWAPPPWEQGKGKERDKWLANLPTPGKSIRALHLAVQIDFHQHTDWQDKDPDLVYRGTHQYDVIIHEDRVRVDTTVHKPNGTVYVSKMEAYDGQETVRYYPSAGKANILSGRHVSLGYAGTALLGKYIGGFPLSLFKQHSTERTLGEILRSLPLPAPPVEWEEPRHTGGSFVHSKSYVRVLDDFRESPIKWAVHPGQAEQGRNVVYATGLFGRGCLVKAWLESSLDGPILRQEFYDLNGRLTQEFEGSDVAAGIPRSFRFTRYTYPEGHRTVEVLLEGRVQTMEERVSVTPEDFTIEIPGGTVVIHGPASIVPW